MDLSKSVFIGRLTRDPEYFAPGRRGEAHVVFTLAVNRVVPNAAGPQADYIPCSLWGEELAKKFCEERSKGDEVYIEGRIRTNSIPQPSGPPRMIWEVRVEKAIYGRRSLKNLQERPAPTPTTRAVGQLSREFSTPNQQEDTEE